VGVDIDENGLYLVVYHELVGCINLYTSDRDDEQVKRGKNYQSERTLFGVFLAYMYEVKAPTPHVG
jgi:hypothetical protein